MERVFVFIKGFDRKLQEIKNFSEVQQTIEATLLSDPEIGDLVVGTHGLRKFRVAVEGKGKSGGIRVLYYDAKAVKKIYLFGFFHKNEKDNLSKEERNILGKTILTLKEEIEKEGSKK